MKELSIALLVLLSGTGTCFADCRDINRESSAKYKAMIAAKEEFKREFSNETQKPFSPASLDKAIIANSKMKIAMDEVIDVLERAQAGNCFGKDNEKWSYVISMMKKEADEIGRTRKDYLQMQEMMRKVR